VAQLDYLLPREYVETMRVMTHAAPVDSWEDVSAGVEEGGGGGHGKLMGVPLRLHPTTTTPHVQVETVFREEFGGRSPDDVFDDFQRAPLASASLAQVHVARLKGTGQKVAVKVQHRGLRETCNVDVTTISLLVRAVKAFFPKFDYEVGVGVMGGGEGAGATW